MASYTVKNVKTFIGNEGHGFNATGLRRKILAQYPSAEGAVILNDLPFEEVVERLEAAA